MHKKVKKSFKKKVIYACRASVSLLLSIILLPVLAFIGVMVDHANLNLSKSIVENGGELTLNASLANYDTVLKDVYGLFAVSQNYDDLSSELEKYFEKTLNANGLLAGASQFQSETMKAIQSDMRDFFNTVTVDDVHSGVVNVDHENFVAKEVEGSQLSNPEVLRNQIVEFMKYRGPAEVGLDLLDSINIFRSASNKVPVTEAKMEMEQRVAEAAELTQHFYECLEMYEEKVKAIQEAEKALTPSVWADIVNKRGTANGKIYFFVNQLDLEDETIYYLELADTSKKKWESYPNCYIINDTEGKNFISEPKEYNSSKNDEINGYISKIDGTGKTIADDFTAMTGKLNDDSGIDKTELKTLLDQYKAFCEDVLYPLSNYGLWMRKKSEELKTRIGNNALARAYKEDDKKEVDLFIANAPTKEECDEAKSQITVLEGKIATENARGKDKDKAKIAAWEEEKKQCENIVNDYENELPKKKNEQKELEDEISALTDQITKDTEEQGKLLPYLNKVHSALSGAKTKVCDVAQSFCTKYQENMDSLVRDIEKCLQPIYQKQHPYYAAIKALLTMDNPEDSFWKKLINNRTNFLDYLEELGEKVKEEMGAVDDAADDLMDAADAYSIATDKSGKTKDEYYTLMVSEAQSAKAQYTTEHVDKVIEQITAVKNYFEDNPDGVYTKLKEKVYGHDFIALDKYYSEKDVVLRDSTAKKICNSAKNVVKAGESEYTCLGNYFSILISPRLYTVDRYVKQLKQAGVKYYDSNGNLVDEMTINVPGFYMYLVTTYGSKPADSVKKDKAENGDNVKDSASNLNEKIKNDSTDIVNPVDESITHTIFDSVDFGEKDNLKAAKAIGDSFGDMSTSLFGKNNILSQFSSMLSLAKGLFGTITGGFENVRDNLLVTTYLFENFSYATIEAEVAKENKKNPSAEPINAFKTLTNVEISKENNAIYGCELEYILYGYKGETSTSGWWIFKKESTTGPGENIKIVKGNIFSVRLLMNSMFALTDKTINTETLAPALAIQAATGGIFPYKVAQVVLKICLALAESLYDVDELLKGEDMPLIKTIDTWRYSVKGMINAVKEEVVDAAADTLEQALKDVYDAVGTELKDLVASGVEYTQDKILGLANKVTENVQSGIQAKMDEAIGVATQALTNAVGESFMEVFTSNIELDTGVLKQKIKDSVMEAFGETESDPQGLKGILKKSGYGDEVANLLGDSIDEMIDKALEKEISIGGTKYTIVSFLKKYHVQISAQSGTVEISSTLYSEFVKGVQEAVNNAVSDVTDSITAKVEQWSESLGNKVKGIVAKKVDGYTDKLEEYTSQKVDEVKGAVKDTLDDLFPESKSNESLKMMKNSDGGKKSLMDNAVLSTITSFSYKDYLRLFIFLNLSANDNGAALLKRTAEVIELNVEKGLKDFYSEKGLSGHAKGEDFTMNKAYTYMTVESTIKVKPLLMSEKMFRRTGSKDNKIIEYWIYDYSTVGGY